MEDREILDLFFARDQRAIGAMSERYGGILLHTAQNILRSREDAVLDSVNWSNIGT